ncbi:MAG: winged helix-turn-helix domain-containing protein [Candidatus Eremiobacteraeota bacterium]|nr:winged helix-turn-helix domain-containing protein [Candidatus Eremiobacteraeota bacterium]
MTRRCYCFGPFRLDADRRTLHRGTSCRQLSERPFQILLALLEADGECVTRDALALRVWGAEGVTDTNLTQHVYLLREILGERRDEGRYILTIGGRGYRLAVPVSRIASETGAMLADAADAAHGALTDNADALQHYCRGNYLLDRRTEPALRAAIAALGKAVEADAAFTSAFVTLGRAWMLLAEYWHEPASIAMPNAQLYVERALKLDPKSAPALSALSELQLCAQWDWGMSRRNLDAALSVDPSLAFARNNAAWFHLYRSEFHEASSEVREALANHPASLPLQLLDARILSHAGKHDDAIAAIGNILAMDPKFVFARRFLTMAYLLAGKPDCALSEIVSEPSDDSEDAVYRLPLLVCAWSMLGERESAERTYRELLALSRLRYVSSWNLAMGAANCGREDEAMALLQNAYRDRDSALLLLPILPIFKALEKRPDFTALVRSIAA